MELLRNKLIEICVDGFYLAGTALKCKYPRLFLLLIWFDPQTWHITTRMWQSLGIVLLVLYIYIYIYTEGYSESTEPIDAVNILPLARFEPTTSTTPPSTTPDIDATNCATETSPKKDVQEALILTTPDAVHVVYWFLFNAWHLFRSQVKAWWIQGYKWNKINIRSAEI